MFVADLSSIRELDRLAIASGTPGLTLMERAAEGVAEAARKMVKGFPSPRILVCCGPGSNGGDGFAAARLLLNEGIETRLLLFERPKVRGDALTNLKRLEAQFAPLHDAPADPGSWPDFSSFSLIIDALFGTGFRGRPADPYLECIRRINASPVHVLSVDTPSGADSETGEVPAEAVRANVTVTFGLPKQGQLFHPARGHVGELTVKDIGLPAKDAERLCGQVRTIDRATALQGVVLRRGDEHKNRCGRVLVVAGSTGLTGAACLTATAALKSGAGVVTLAVPESLNPIFEIKLTEVMTRPFPDRGKGFLSAAHAGPILALARDYDILALGPGLGSAPATAALARGLAQNSPVPVVLDADGINAFKGRAPELTKAKSPLLITPHEGETRRLLGLKQVPTTAGERIAFCRETAAKLGCGLLLKGATTLVAFPGRPLHVNTTGNPGMATAGAGDVLTGLIAGLAAQGAGLEKAAVTAAWLHGLSGDAAALALTEYPLTAGDLISYLPHAFKDLL